MPGERRAQTWPYNPTLDAPAKYRRAGQYEAFVPELLSKLQFQLPADISGLVSDAELAIGRLNQSATSVHGPLGRLLLRTESIASWKVDGMQIGVRGMARPVARAERGAAPNRSAPELLDNLNDMELTLREAVEADPFGVEQVCAIHTRLMQHVPTQHGAGVVRTKQNWFGGNDYNPCGAEFVPPPPEEVSSLLADLCAAINDETLPPVVQAALVQAQFEAIQPFDDGNGRTGRALVHIVLRRRGLAPRFVPPISVVLASSRARYFAGLTGFRGDGVTAWVEHFCSATARAARLATAYVVAVEALRERWRGRLAAMPNAPRRGAAAWGVIDVLPAHPVITGPVATAATGMVKTAIYGAIGQLVAANVLLPLSASRRNRAWEAEGLLDLIEQLESGQFPD